MSAELSKTLHFKDEILDRVARTANVAQFVSFGPGSPPPLRYSRMTSGLPQGASPDDAIRELLARASDGSVNVRSFDPAQPRGHDFVYGITDPAEASETVQRLAASGLFTIVNETIDIHDGGVSGVVAGDVIEFAPEDTPRAVDKPGIARMPRELGARLLGTVYGFEPDLDFPPDVRVEFSLHPRQRGNRQTHTLVWEEERDPDAEFRPPEIEWPNRFSRFIGDKAFGLLVADALGLRVPATTVIPRHVAPFRFGVATGTGEVWTRTCPVVQVPGRFTTRRGWTDPFRLLHEEDLRGDMIASVLAQDGIDACYSGAAVSTGGDPIIEGVAGFGDAFMQGAAPPESLPREVVEGVRGVHRQTNEFLGSSRLEWIYDGSEIWVVQLHRGGSPSRGLTIYPGTAVREHEFDVAEGLEALRDLVAHLEGTADGIVLVGDVGITSHFGDVLRRAAIPSRLRRN